MKKQLLFGLTLCISVAFSNVLFSQAPVRVDPAVYAPRGANNEFSLTNKWLFSNVLQNYNTAADFFAPSGMVRGMAVKDGKMLFIDRSNRRIAIVNGATGARETPLPLASNLFTFMGRNRANTADSLWSAGLWGFQDIKVDNAGNVLVSNLITSNAGRYQIWKIDMTTGAGTLVIDQSDLATLFPMAATMRFDAFGVWGNVNTNAIIMAANASTVAMEVYKWRITNGVAGLPELIELDNSAATGRDLANLANLGSAPQVFPLDENFFYVDGNATFPVLIDMQGNVIDGFRSNLSALTDSISAPPARWLMNEGHNGVVEFEIDGKFFLVMAASNTGRAPFSSFRLFQFADASKEFRGLRCLWTFPQAGMGNASNAYRTAVPSVEVVGKTAKIYVYTGENGYGMYEFRTDNVTSVSNTNESTLKITLEGNHLFLSEVVSRVELFNVAGQRISVFSNVANLPAPATRGVYLVKVTDIKGAKQVQKVLVP